LLQTTVKQLHFFSPLLQYLTSNWVELLGFAFGILYVILIIRENVWGWVAGIANVGLYIVIFFGNRIYGAGILQCIYLAMSMYGLYSWLGRGKKSDQKKTPSISRTPIYRWLPILLFIFAGSISGGILLSYSDNPVPYWDGITTALGLAATWMTARKYLENWLVWIVNDIICTLVYASQLMYLTTILYLVLATMAVVGYLQWRKSLKGVAT
jgi:nicotinamide mononucleotide transporter